MYCKKCGNELRVNENYCSKCGQAVSNETIMTENKKSINRKISLKTIIIMIIIFSIAIGIGIYIANNELTNAGKKQEQYQQEMTQKYLDEKSNKNENTKSVTDILPNHATNDEKAKEAAEKAKNKYLEAESAEQNN